MADVPGDSTTGATIGIGGVIDGAIEALGDHDWYRIDLTAGQKVTIAVNLLTLEDSYIYLRSATGAVLAQNDDGGGGRGSRLIYTAPTSGTYYIDVSAWVNDGSDPDYSPTGGYRLSVSNYVAPSEGTLDEFAYQMTHGFFGGASHRFNVTEGGTITVDLTAITPTGRTVALQALEQWSDIIGVSFVEQTGGAQITFDDLDQGTGAFADTTHANGITSSAIVNVASYRINLHTYMHEIAHALGLGHTSNSNAGTAAAIYPDDAIWSNDGAAISIMSYFDNAENGYYSSRNFSHVPIKTPQVADIIAMGNLYGLSTTTRTGNTTYGFNNNSGRTAFDAVLNPNVSYTVFDSAGIDTLDYSGFATNQLINLNSEAFSNVGPAIGNVVIARGTVIENAIGGSGADQLIGNDANNILTGNAGSDILTGGGGADSFRGTITGLNGDTIVDLTAQDHIHFTGAAIGGFTFGLTGSALSFTGGSLMLGVVPAGQLVASAVLGGGIALMVAGPEPMLRTAGTSVGDFNGDGRDDILWRSDSGRVANWLGQTNGGFASAGITNAGNDWKIAGTGDFNGDGRQDILWRQDFGQLATWLGQASGSFESRAGAMVSPDWTIAGIGDFDGDGRDDIVWRNSAGDVTDWLGQSDGGFVGNSANSYYQVSPSWRIAGTGDFNGDGREDLLWRSDSGQTASWLGQANGAFDSFAGSGVGSEWDVAGIGDFNGDGRGDIVWRSVSGQITNWLGQAGGGFSVNAVSLNGAGWHVVGTGDFNGDGRQDILWRHDTLGQVDNWLGQADGGFARIAGGNPGTDWHVDSIGDFNNDGRDDLVWRSDSDVTSWLGRADGGFADNSGNASAEADTNWTVAGGAIPYGVTERDARNDFNGDGRSDLLLRNGSGQLVNWLGQADGGFGLGTSASAGTEWHIAGTGDFNGDGRDDILWRHTDGYLTDWPGQADGSFQSDSDEALQFVLPSWHVVGTGDFNGDGRDDILWRHESGLVANWLGLSNGGFVSNVSVSAGTDWTIAGTGDFNGDGRDDILWRNDKGDVTDWLGGADGSFLSNSGNAFYQVAGSWTIAGTGDFDGDGRDDILWRNGNQVANWLGQSDGGFLSNAAANVGTAGNVASIGDFNGDGSDDILWRDANGRITNWLGQADGSIQANSESTFYQVDNSWILQSNPSGASLWDY